MTARDGTNADIQVVIRLAQILRQFGAGQTTIRLAHAAQELGMQRSTLHRYLNSMATAGLLERNEDAEYTLGPLLVQLGTMALSGLHVTEASRPAMQQLAEETGETVVLSVWGGTSAVVARVEAPDKLVQVLVRTGSLLPLNAAQSHVFLAFLGNPQADRALSTLPEETRSDLEAGVAKVRRDGIVIRPRVVEGIRTIAVPLLDGSGRIQASLALVGTTEAVPDDPRSGLARSLIATGATLSRQMGFADTYPALSDVQQNQAGQGHATEVD